MSINLEKELRGKLCKTCLEALEYLEENPYMVLAPSMSSVSILQLFRAQLNGGHYNCASALIEYHKGFGTEFKEILSEYTSHNKITPELLVLRAKLKMEPEPVDV